MRIYQYRGFTLVELLVIMVVIVILTAMAIPSYTKMRQDAKRTVCIANLRQIDGAIEQWAIINDITEGVRLTPYADQIYAFLHGDRPTCPSGGTYTLTRLGQYPQVRCNITGHVLPESQ